MKLLKTVGAWSMIFIKAVIKLLLWAIRIATECMKLMLQLLSLALRLFTGFVRAAHHRRRRNE